MADRPREARDERPAGRSGSAGEQTLRAFFAVALEGSAQRHAERELARLRALPGAHAVRWVRPEGLHMTLRFLGEVAVSALPELLARVAACTREVSAFEWMLGGAIAFPSPRRARVVALEAGPEAPLQRLAGAIERGVVEAGFAPEPRGFRPHVTLGRVRRGARLARDFARAMTVPDTPGSDARAVTEAVLFRSDPSRNGSIYTSIGRVPLQRPPGAPDPESPLNP